MVQVQWVVPCTLGPTYTKTRILRATQENGDYSLVGEIDGIVNQTAITNFTDPTGDRRYHFYIAKFYDPIANAELNAYALGFYPPSPREKRWRDWITDFLPPVMRDEVSDEDIGQAIRYSINMYNLIPAFTSFTVDTLPQFDEPFVILGAQVWLLYLKYLNLSIRDFGYSDMGLSLNIDRGAKINQAIETLNKQYLELARPAKWRFTPQGIGLGTVPLPISLGGNLNRGLLNVLDIFNAFGR
jgi:hypothetical protein